jgi:Fe-Mn family superoxide dismutase
MNSKVEHSVSMTRRAFLGTVAFTGAAAVVGGLPAFADLPPMSGTLPPLPYPENALEPIISAQTLSFHYGKHHKGYWDRLQTLIKGTPWAESSLERIVTETIGNPETVAIFQNSAQVWNHTFYWSSMKPNGGGEPQGELRKAIDASFGSVDTCRKEFSAAAVSQFASGWAWLIRDGDRLRIVKTGNADLPMGQGIKPLLTIDVWEHAYYLDYQNRRADYVNAVIERLLNWSFAEKNWTQNG